MSASATQVGHNNNTNAQHVHCCCCCCCCDYNYMNSKHNASIIFFHPFIELQTTNKKTTYNDNESFSCTVGLNDNHAQFNSYVSVKHGKCSLQCDRVNIFFQSRDDRRAQLAQYRSQR